MRQGGSRKMQNNEQRFSFTGTGSEYFRIWIVNLLLTILTLGIYSAWAKVRRMQYFYRNTRLNESSFDYHGTPIAILKGRLIGIGLFAVYYGTLKVAPLIGLAVGLVIVLMVPFLLVVSFQFRLYNSSYRGIHFGFSGSIKSAFVTFLAFPVITVITLCLLAPFTHQRIKAYQINNSHLGQSHFTFNAGAGDFYKIYLLVLVQFIAIVGLFSYTVYRMLVGNIANIPEEEMIKYVLAFYGIAIAATLLIAPYFIARIQNLIWNHTELGANRFSSTMSVFGLAWIILSNFILIVLTLGLFKPFADIRLARYKMEHMALLAAGNIEEFIASQQQQISATGTETAEIFDFDIGF